MVPGLPTSRDGRDGSGFTVDFTHDEADPPFAIEVTRLRDDFERPAAAELRDLEGRLQRHVTGKGSPHWSVGHPDRDQAQVRPGTGYSPSHRVDDGGLPRQAGPGHVRA